ncbi:hypothetical protein K2173_008664 [Erythroxylum novogranatense]|uniref:1,3-beta-glucan synthase n=1 Tax=Erythroxylum novogranatense TaxID=1862640 RepID=A0AAV8SLP5_9ROSI|nr:hypothetical protein K2173_008664 [Erythroxylum novogranatense]
MCVDGTATIHHHVAPIYYSYTRDLNADQAPPPSPVPDVYNIIPILTDHRSLRYPEVPAVSATLLAVGNTAFCYSLFGFQRDNGSNQREHLVLHLANSQMRLDPPPSIPDTLHAALFRRFRKKLLENYTSWCSFLGRKSQVTIRERSKNNNNNSLHDLRCGLSTLLYIFLFGVSQESWFMLECLCYIYHHMAMELKDFIDRELTPILAAHFFLRFMENDDLDEFFLSRRCLKKLKWPIDLLSNYFATVKKSKRIKRRFVEREDVRNVFRSFDKLWVLLILHLCTSIIVAGRTQSIRGKLWKSVMCEVELLTCFITGPVLGFLIVFDAELKYSLVRGNMVVRIEDGAKVLGCYYMDYFVCSFLCHDLGAKAEVLGIGVFLYFLGLGMHLRNWIGAFCICSHGGFTRLFVGRGLVEGPLTTSSTHYFGFFRLVSKFVFSYFLQIKPLAAPTKALLNLGNMKYNWHEFFASSNKIVVVLIWLPVALIYFMDLHIWYSIFSSLVGVAIGFFSNLGEIRNIEQLRLRFQFFASAMQFNLMPEEQLSGPKMTLVKKLRDAILRYGLVEATRFALIWNEIITTFRVEDLISNREHELLELPPNYWNISVIRWPCVLLCNELLLALSQAMELADAPDRWVWLKICQSEYRRCAVIEAYDSVRYLLLKALKDHSEEISIVETFFHEIDSYIQIGKFTEAYKMMQLEKIHSKLILFIELLMKQKRDLNAAVNILQALYELGIREFPMVKRTTMQLRLEGLAPQSQSSENGLQLSFLMLKSMTRRIAFFSNSLFMIEKMMAFGVLTPYYDEEVCFGKENLRSQNEDGISTLFYLLKIYADEWKNFIERMHREGMEDDDEICDKKSRDLRQWASYRGQTLSRTMLAYLDSASEMHYGHPDVFDRCWFKKDQPPGLNQISMFEAKVASGNGEQTLSRDVYRLGHRLNFFRMLSFYYTTVGYYFDTMMVVLIGYASEKSTDNKAFAAILNQQFIIQIGLFTALPMIVENSLEHGFLQAVWDFLTMQLQLASLFYTFSLGTRTHYFATGRDFVVQHKSFADNNRLYARSHFVKAVELGVILTVYASNSPLAANTFVYILTMISSSLLVVSWILSPFLFDPSGFDWLKAVYVI